MKRTTIILSLIFALAIALSVSIPTVALTSDTTDIIGSLAAKIDVSAPASYDLNTLPATVANAFDVTVICNARNWHVTAQAPLMDGDTEGALTNSLEVTPNGGTNWYAVSSATTIWTGTDKTGGSGVGIPVGLRQTIVDGVDYPDDYSTTITFAGVIP